MIFGVEIGPKPPSGILRSCHCLVGISSAGCFSPVMVWLAQMDVYSDFIFSQWRIN